MAAPQALPILRFRVNTEKLCVILGASNARSWSFKDKGVPKEDLRNEILKTLAGPVTIQRADVQSVEVSPNSLMPEGLLSEMDGRSVRDLFLYLRQKSQVPLLATQANAGDFFNGNDLSKWRASSDDAWKVENGEIVGHGGAKKAAWLRSEMIAGDYKLSGTIKIKGTNPIVELAYYGRPDVMPFVGESLSMGGPSKVNLWYYRRDAKPKPSDPAPVAIEQDVWTKIVIISKGKEVLVTFAPLPEPIKSFGWMDPEVLPSPDRNGFAFYVQGSDSELRIKDLKLETDTK